MRSAIIPLMKNYDSEIDAGNVHKGTIANVFSAESHPLSHGARRAL